jgi:hypothetical protein
MQFYMYFTSVLLIATSMLYLHATQTNSTLQPPKTSTTTIQALSLPSPPQPPSTIIASTQPQKRRSNDAYLEEIQQEDPMSLDEAQRNPWLNKLMSAALMAAVIVGITVVTLVFGCCVLCCTGRVKGWTRAMRGRKQKVESNTKKIERPTTGALENEAIIEDDRWPAAGGRGRDRI